MGVKSNTPRSRVLAVAWQLGDNKTAKAERGHGGGRRAGGWVGGREEGRKGRTDGGREGHFTQL